MDIIDFYKRVLETLEITTDDEGYLMIVDGDKKIAYKNNGTPIVLPTKGNIASMLAEDDSGKIVTVKQLFNPLDETVIKGDSVSLTKLKKLIEVRLSNRIMVIGKLLLTIASNKKLQMNTSMVINEFLVRLSEAKAPGILDVVDSKTIDKWCKIYSESFTPNKTRPLTVFVKKGGKINNDRYNRVTTLKFPIYEELCNFEKGAKVNDVAMRPKDVKVFKMVYEYLVNNISSLGIVSIGSNDKESPGFISLYGTYLSIMMRIQEVLSSISGVDDEWEEAGFVTISVDPSELIGLGKYNRALLNIPRSSEVIAKKLSTPVETITAPPSNTGSALNTSDAIRKALYGNSCGMTTPVVNTQQPGVVQPQYPQTVQPQYPQTVQPQYPQTVQPQYPQTVQPQYPQTVQPQYPQTVQPQYPQTVQPGRGQPTTQPIHANQPNMVGCGIRQPQISIGGSMVTHAFG